MKRKFPDALVQWEDFAKHKAFSLLERYRDRVLSFDDDIQGTGAVAASVLMTAMRIKKSRLADQRIGIVGMGQAGIGIATNVLALLKAEGLSDAEARRGIYTGDTPGLLCEDTPGLSKWQRPFARDRAEIATWTLASSDRVNLMDTVRNAKLTVLVGVTAQPGLFSAEVLSTMASYEPQPVILALSNPTSRCECRPEDVARATDGRGLVATGSPFPDLEWKGRTLVSSQCNNMYVFPGVGLGALVAKAPKVTHGMFLAASRALSAMVTPEHEAKGLMLPPMRDIRAVSRAVAKAVAIEARDAGLGRLIDDAKYEEIIAKAQWEPAYTPYRPGKAGG